MKHIELDAVDESTFEFAQQWVEASQENGDRFESVESVTNDLANRVQELVEEVIQEHRLDDDETGE